jgi:hypothetical protein
VTMRHVLSGRGSSLAREDRIARSGQVGRGLPAWRRSMATSCRNTSTSAINTVLLPASSISHPSTRTVSKYKRRNATGGDHAGVLLVTKRQVTAAASSSGTAQAQRLCTYLELADKPGGQSWTYSGQLGTERPTHRPAGPAVRRGRCWSSPTAPESRRRASQRTCRKANR